jgi:hypothetical protein
MPVPETGDHLEPSKGNYVLKADGSGTGTNDNPAQGAIGVVLRDPNGHLGAWVTNLPVRPAGLRPLMDERDDSGPAG